MIMIILFILGLILGAVSVAFTLQNTAVITVNFLSWQLTGSLALILSLAIASGILIAFLLTLPESISNYLRYRRVMKENKRLEEDLRRQKELTVFAKNTPPTPEEISKIEEGVSIDPAP